MPSHYETFLQVVSTFFTGTGFYFNGLQTQLHPSILSPYQLLRDTDVPLSDVEKYVSTLSEGFITNAKTELYRSGRGWIDRGIKEGKIIKYIENERINIVPRINDDIAIGIDSSKNLFVICCFDNFDCGIQYLEKYIKIPKYYRTNEFKWSSLNTINRNYIINKLNTLLNVSCKAFFAINSTFIQSKNHFTRNQFTGLIEGCFTGYEQYPRQNSVQRQALRRMFFKLCDGNGIHCDPDFGSLQPNILVRFLVRNLSRINNRVQDCTPSYVTLKSHESEPIQLADIIAGALSDQILYGQIPPIPSNHLYFNEKQISRKDRKNGHRAKSYYWIREGG